MGTESDLPEQKRTEEMRTYEIKLPDGHFWRIQNDSVSLGYRFEYKGEVFEVNAVSHPRNERDVGAVGYRKVEAAECHPPVSLDPKGEAGSKKAPLHLLPAPAMEQIAWVHKSGAEKYGPYNWRSNQVCATTYVSAIRRHLGAWQDGEDLDPESGISHLAHIGASINILLDAKACGTLSDDRFKLPAP